MNQIRIFTLKDKKKWKNIISRVKNADIYYLPEYLAIYQPEYTSQINHFFCGQPHLFFYGNEKEFIIYPFLKRSINQLDFAKNKLKKDLFDIISPYGYSGPLIVSRQKNNSFLIKNFFVNFRNFCQENNIVAEFVRFHPLFKNGQKFKKFLNLEYSNTTFPINLKQPIKQILAKMNKKTRNLIRKSEKNNLKITSLISPKNIAIFNKLYLKTMLRNKADIKYFFPNNFFQNTFSNLEGKSFLFIVKWKNFPVAASIFIFYKKNVHYHFSGSDEKYLFLCPNNFLVWKAIKKFRKMGFQQLHLGGGLKDNDALSHFKEGFTDRKRQFFIAKVIHLPKEYQNLITLRNLFGKEIKDEQFFPYYRN